MPFVARHERKKYYHHCQKPRKTFDDRHRWYGPKQNKYSKYINFATPKALQTVSRLQTPLGCACTHKISKRDKIVLFMRHLSIATRHKLNIPSCILF